MDGGDQHERDGHPERPGVLGSALRRAARRLPGVRRAAETLDRTRAERDRLREQRDALRDQRDARRDRVRELTAERDRLRAQAEDRLAVLQRPSFTALLAKSRRQKELARERHGRGDPIWALNPKTAAYELADELGLSRPETYWRGTDLGELDVDALPDRFVVKPVDGTAARGVYPLVRDPVGSDPVVKDPVGSDPVVRDPVGSDPVVSDPVGSDPAVSDPVVRNPLLREGDGVFRSLFDVDPLTLADVAAELAELRRAGRVGSEILVEELVPRSDDPHELPFDWKVYCFGGRAELVLQKDPCRTRRNDIARFKFYDRDWRDLGAVRYQDLVDPDLPPPRDPEAILSVAERVATALERVFIRVDLFEGPDGPLFAEITPHPGGVQWYGPELDERLGRAWEDAEVRLGVTDTGGGPRR